MNDKRAQPKISLSAENGFFFALQWRHRPFRWAADFAETGLPHSAQATFSSRLRAQEKHSPFLSLLRFAEIRLPHSTQEIFSLESFISRLMRCTYIIVHNMSLKKHSINLFALKLTFPAAYPFPCFFSSFAHVSFSATVRLNTGAPGFESGSTATYPRRSN